MAAVVTANPPPVITVGVGVPKTPGVKELGVRRRAAGRPANEFEAAREATDQAPAPAKKP